MKNSNKIYTIGIDIGGTNLKAVLFDGQKVIADYQLATPKDNLEHFLVMVKALAEPLMEKARQDKIKIKGIGLSVAGPVNYEKQIVIKAPNIPLLDGLKLGDRLKGSHDLDVKIDNDGNCFVRAEAILGAGKKYSDIYGLTLGTSLGTSWWRGNKIHYGFHGSAGETTHMIISYPENLSFEKAYQKLTQNNPGNLAEEAYRGDALAEKTYEEIGKILGVVMANIVNLIDPEIIIIGGGVIKSSGLFLPEAKKTMREFIINPEAKKIKIIKSNLGEYASAIGAALLV
ncbi:hypothetical protein COV49_01810 [Candidatus Falkowbacteria bacterium CG11_big_fil_rev_8_21_14_0_20_39_10]|uniref:Sugar kinase n=1 Tax=Candidatus Falkowbacteria bacterium CG11_big_fil_rev_8_21_14_0_20_39_10 TaxID=1974570 RepID=A0A2M6K984_9BACT|nr:MAG: hypothetical protein COV49_01810 [Candidatus Falkowbacteria bacterium CG11_big_fil_rev_8_21_14_0_20_39_10]